MFLSHQHLDKLLVTEYAEELSKHIGKDQLLIDGWNIKPGESIIDFMSGGIDQATHFVLFWSKNSNSSAAVKEEWQAALMKSHKGTLHIVIVKIDNEPLPAILAHRLYIDHQYGFGKCVSELIKFSTGVLDAKKSSRQMTYIMR